MMRTSVLVVVLATSCSQPNLPPARFANAQPVWLVNDRRDTPHKPEANDNLVVHDWWMRSFLRPLARPLELNRERRALGVNSFDEVPDSTWFTNRIGAHELTDDQIRTGPMEDDSAANHRPWTVKSTKLGGDPVQGLIVTDTRGVKVMIKFDEKDFPELQSASHIVVSRLLWAAGYNVPQDEIAYIRLDDLIVPKGVPMEDRLGHTFNYLTKDMLAKAFEKIAREPDGSIRVLVSRWLPGKVIGGPPLIGVRDGDPNDRIPHELRRDLRGMYPILAWVDHVDLVFGNFLDVWVPDRADPKRHYVEHYLIDFGKSMGGMGGIDHTLRHGYTYVFDWGDTFSQFLQLGLNRRPWGHDFAPKLTGVSPLFTASQLEPGGWVPDIQYEPFQDMDRFDGFWGAKIVARFRPDQIRAAVAAAKYSDPRAAEYVTRTLLARQRATLVYWFERVNPLDRFTASPDVGGTRVCFADLAVDADLASADATRYAIERYDAHGAALAQADIVPADASGTTCSPAQPLAPGRDGYTIFEVQTVRPHFAGKTYVHVARDLKTGEARVIGIWRS